MSLVTIEPSPASEPGTSPFASATANIQAAARWIVAALAAVGGVLVSSVPLTALGRTNSVHELVGAGIGLLVALGAVGFTIATAARVFTTEHITLAALAARRLPTSAGRGPEPIEATITQITRSREELFGEVAEDLGDLNERLAGANRALRIESAAVVSAAEAPRRVVAYRGSARTRANRAAARDAALGAETELSPLAARLHNAAKTVVEFANYDSARRNFRTLTSRLLVAGFIAVIGVTDYAYWISRPDSQVEHPTPVLVNLAQGSSQARSLGANCDLTRIFAVEVSGSVKRPTIVTVPTDRCAARRFRVPSNSVLVPVRNLPSP
jgi:hypothetical protein